jgi:hypothetical protein
MADGSLWPVIVGGAIALGGVAITNGINFLMKRGESQEARKKARAAKFEELVAAVYQYNHWLDTKQNIAIFKDPGKLEVSPLSKIEAISAVYFPQFRNAIEQLDRGGRGFESWIYEAAQRYAASPNTFKNEGLHEAYLAYLEKRDSLLAELRKYAAKEFQ